LAIRDAYVWGFPTKGRSGQSINERTFRHSKRWPMTIMLSHKIVPARDKETSAHFFAQLFGLSFEGQDGHFAPVRVNETFTLLFDDDIETFESLIMRSTSATPNSTRSCSGSVGR